MAKFVLVSTDFAVNMDYVTDVQVSGSDVQLAYPQSAKGSAGHYTLSCADSATAQKVFEVITQAFDPKAT